MHRAKGAIRASRQSLWPAIRKRIRIQPSQRVDPKLTPEEREAVLEIVGLDSELEDRIRRTSPNEQNLESSSMNSTC